MNRLKKTFENLLSLGTGQVYTISMLGLFAFLQSVSIVLFDGVATGLYLGTFGTLDLSILFVAAAVLLSVAGFFTIGIERRFGKGLSTFFIIAVVLQICLLMALNSGWKQALDILFVSKFAYRLLISVGFWALALRFIVLDLDSKKFLFIVLMDFAGLMIGGYSLPMLSLGMSLSALLWLNAFLGIVFICLYRTIAGTEKNAPLDVRRRNGGVSEPAQINLMHLIFCTSFLYAGIKCFIDDILCTELAYNFPQQPVLITSVMGAVWGTIGLLSIAGLIIFYHIRTQFSVIYGLVIIALLPIFTFFGWWGQLLSLAITAKIIFEIVSYFCISYYFRMIPRPLTHGHKLRLKVMRLVLFEPIGFAFVALFFYFTPIVVVIAFVSLFLTLFSVSVLHLTRVEYANVLLSSFKTFRWRGGRLLINTPKVISFVTEKAASKNPDEAIYFLRVLEDAKHAKYAHYIGRALKHSEERVRNFALDRIERHNFRTFNKTVSQMLDKDTSQTVRQTALRVLCATGEKYSQEKAILYLDDPALKKGALVALLKSGGEGVLVASEGVNKLVASAKTADRLEAAQILEESAIKGFYRLILSLMKDKDVNVRCSALLAAGRIAHPLLLPSIFKALENLNLRDCAIQALKYYSIKAYPAIEQALIDERTSTIIKNTLITYLWVCEDSAAHHTMINALGRVVFLERLNMLYHLKDRKIAISSRKRAQILRPLIDKDYRQAVTILRLVKDFSYAPIYEAEESFRALRDSLENEFFQIRQSLLLELKLLFPSNIVQQAVTILLTQDKNDYDAAAIGIVEDMLAGKMHRLSFILKDMSFDKRLEHIPALAPKMDRSMSGLLSFIISKSSYRSPWTRACALMCARKIGDIALLPDILDTLQESNPLMLESAVWALGRMGLSQKELKKYLTPLIDNPHQSVRQTVDDILES